MASSNSSARHRIDEGRVEGYKQILQARIERRNEKDEASKDSE